MYIKGKRDFIGWIYILYLALAYIRTTENDYAYNAYNELAWEQIFILTELKYQSIKLLALMLFMILHICNHYENNQYNGWVFSVIQVGEMAFKGKINKIKGTTYDSGNNCSPTLWHSATSTSLETQMNSGQVLCYIYPPLPIHLWFD